jgi:hypothetical protein
MFRPTVPFEEQLGILEFVDHIEPYPMDIGEDEPVMAKPIGVFEYTLSRHGIYMLAVTPNRTVLTTTSYGRTRKKAEFPTLLDALDYVYRNHPYEREGDDE